MTTNGHVEHAPADATHVPLLINGQEIHTDKTFDVINPSTGEVLHKSSAASVADAIKAVEAAQKAFPKWRDTPPAAKRDLFLKAAEIIERRAEELGKYMIEETGSGEFWATNFNVPLAADGLKDIAGRISGIQGSMPNLSDPGKSALVFKEPYGVILGIAPWYVDELQ
jgi:acyl-CoA reductase-like NAD-dependent aldehyde dehydrogenase